MILEIQPELFFSILTSVISGLVGLLISILIYQINRLANKVDTLTIIAENSKTRIDNLSDITTRHERQFTRVFELMNEKQDKDHIHGH